MDKSDYMMDAVLKALGDTLDKYPGMYTTTRDVANCQPKFTPQSVRACLRKLQDQGKVRYDFEMGWCIIDEEID